MKNHAVALDVLHLGFVIRLAIMIRFQLKVVGKFVSQAIVAMKRSVTKIQVATREELVINLVIIAAIKLDLTPFKVST